MSDQNATNATLLLTDDTNGTKLHKRNNSTEQVMSASSEKKVVGVRLADLMKEALSLKAELNGRSLSGEIVFRLRKSLEQELENEKQRA
ncbi:Arc family DNA-binding protein [Pseudomonas iridis]|uniref:Arc family DNA-binding protein n=1 Tax=Pseudomonas atacamensis TaxID=2565368 RepID=UPI003C92FF5D